MKEFKEIPKKEEKMGITKTYATVEEWKDDLEKYKKGEVVGFYQRGGYPELAEREKKIAELVGMKEDEVVLFNAGMAAIRESLEAESLTKGDVVVYSPYLYGQSKNYVEKELPKRGIKTVPVESGNIEQVEKAIDEHKPKVVFVETLGNAPNMPIVEVDRLISKVEETNKEYQGEHSFSKQLEKIISRKDEFYKELLPEIEEVGRKVNQTHSYMPLRSLIRKLEKEFPTMKKFSERRDILLELKSIIDTA